MNHKFLTVFISFTVLLSLTATIYIDLLIVTEMCESPNNYIESNCYLSIDYNNCYLGVNHTSCFIECGNKEEGNYNCIYDSNNICNTIQIINYKCFIYTLVFVISMNLLICFLGSVVLLYCVHGIKKSKCALI